MHVKGIIWVGARVENREAATSFFAAWLGMDIESDVPGFSRLVTENGDRLELFGPDSIEHDLLVTGPVAGFWVDDIDGAHAELTKADLEEVTPIQRGGDGHRWFYFMAPGGNYYEICEHPGPRAPKALEAP
jgi:catechol 2,3-dioxygenase-like lactoylglutathione lyase family enzyme